MLTSTQFYIVYLGAIGISGIIQLNLFYWMVYRAEIPFLEQYKVEKD